jgi:hypothetical protein
MLNVDNIREIAKYRECADMLSLLLISNPLSIFISHNSLLQYLSECHGLPYTQTFGQLVTFSHLPPTRLAKLALKTNDFRLYNYHCNQLSDKIKSAKTALKYGNTELFKHIATQNNIALASFIEEAVEFNHCLLSKEILTQNRLIFKLSSISSKVKTFKMWTIIVKYMSVEFNDMYGIILNYILSENTQSLIKIWIAYNSLSKLTDDDLCFLFTYCDDSMLVEIVKIFISKEFVFIPKYL